MRFPKTRRVRQILFGLLLAGATAYGQADPSTEVSALKGLSLEQLMNAEVTSVSRSPQALFDAPAAIQVITSDDIAGSGATSIPEALRLATNLEVAQENSHDWAISARGFDAALANKLLVLVDGRAVYTPLYGGVLWNVQDYLLADVDRVEVISGPAGTQWGANAVNGVINIDTKSSRDTQGLLVSEAGAGSVLEDQSAVRYGGMAGPDVSYRVYGEYTQRGSEVLPDGQSAGDTVAMARGGFRVDAAPAPDTTLTLQGDAYHGTDYESVGDEGLEGQNVLGRWTRNFDGDSQMTLLTYFDRTWLSLPLAASPASPPYYSGFPASALVDNLETYDIDFQDRIGNGAPRQLVWGLSYRFTRESDSDQNIVQFEPGTQDQSLVTAFAEEQVALGRTAHLTAGTKVEHNGYTGWELEPSLRAEWNFAPGQMAWAAVSRAVRTPARYDRDLVLPTGLENPPPPYQFPEYYLTGSHQLGDETELAYELGWRAQLAPAWSVAVSSYYNTYDHLESTAATPTTLTYPYPLPVVFENGLKADTYGAEISSEYQVTAAWRLRAGYDQLHERVYSASGYTDTTGGRLLTADPRNQWFARTSFVWGGKLRLDADWRWIDHLAIVPSPTSGPTVGIVPAYQEADARISWMMRPGLELSVTGQSLLHSSHLEYGYSDSLNEQIRRNIFAQAEWKY
ncbi:MAG TPA: TonB-dependent receptor plug domain-containing protein [Opitutaceae bacterium]|jgi:iron complex outermembrane receptor protein